MKKRILSITVYLAAVMLIAASCCNGDCGDNENNLGLDAVHLPNTYIVAPGRSLSFPVTKAFAMWEVDPVLSSIAMDVDATPSAVLLSQSEAGLITSVTYSPASRAADWGAQIKVQAAVGKMGNAIVAFKAGDNILWSWTIWVTDYNPNSGTTYKKNGFTFMDRNLGATSTTEGTPASMGNLYQWGSKNSIVLDIVFDPILDMGESRIASMKNASGGAVEYTLVNVSSDPKVNMQSMVADPMGIIIYNNRPPERSLIQEAEMYVDDRPEDDWYGSTPNDDLWGQAGGKSPYDPCPQGWVPYSTIAVFPWQGTGEQPWEASSYTDYGVTIPGAGFYQLVPTMDDMVVTYTIPKEVNIGSLRYRNLRQTEI